MGIMRKMLMVSPATKGAFASICMTGVGVDQSTLGANSSMIGSLGTEGEVLCVAPREMTVGVSSEGEIFGDAFAPSSHKAAALSGIWSRAEPSRIGASRGSSQEAEELKLAMEVSGIAGLSYDKQIGKLNEVLGQLVAKKHEGVSNNFYEA
jgi:hypothetical protein